MAWRTVHCLAVLLLALPLSCGTFGSSNHLHAPLVETATLPVRELSVVLLLEDADQEAETMNLISRTSGELENQVGIRLKMKERILVQWNGRSRMEMLSLVRKVMADYPGDFDVAVARCRMTFLETAQYALFGGWEGVIDAAQRRFIVVRRNSMEILMHEICHAFIFNTTHSGRGLMTGLSFQIFPGLSLNRTVKLSEEDKREVLRNKFRPFTPSRQHTVSVASQAR